MIKPMELTALSQQLVANSVKLQSLQDKIDRLETDERQPVTQINSLQTKYKALRQKDKADHEVFKNRVQESLQEILKDAESRKAQCILKLEELRNNN
jgi:hypothetical protein